MMLQALLSYFLIHDTYLTAFLSWLPFLPQKIPVRRDRCYSPILTCSHTYCTPLHTWAHSLPRHPRPCERQAQADKSLFFDISAALLTVCFTILPFWGKNCALVENILWCHPLKRVSRWVLMYKEGAAGVLVKIFLHHRRGYFVISVFYGLL